MCALNGQGYVDDFFKKNFVGASFAQGAFPLRKDAAGACQVLVNGGFVNNYVR